MKKLLFILMSVAALLGWSTVSAQGTYSKVTSADDLVEDGVYLIASAEYGMALGMNFGNNTARERAEVTVTNGVISTEVATEATDQLPYEIVLKKSGNDWALYDAVNQAYIARVSDDSKNQIQNQAEPYAWTITIDADGNVDILGSEGTPRRILYMKTAGSERFSAYKAVNSTNVVVQLYKRGGVYVDEKAPEIKSVEATNATTVEVLFNEALDATSAETAANYTVNNDITVSAAQLGEDGKTVTLTTSEMTAGSYELTVNGVKDEAGNATENIKATFAFGTIEVENIAALVGMRDTYVKGQKYLVKGEVVVTALIGKFGSAQTTTNAWVQDKGCETSKGHSMMLYYVNDLLKDAKVGDVLSGLEGELTVYNDLLEMQHFDDVTVEIKGTADITVDDVTISDLSGADKWLYQNAMVRVKGVEFADGGETFESKTSYNISDGSNSIAIYTNREGSYLGTKIPLTKCDVTAYVGYNKGNAQLGLRTKEDIVASTNPGTAVENNESIRFSVYPNPTEGLLNVELAEGGQFSLVVYNTNGMQVMHREGLVDNARLDLSGLAHGMYIVEIRTAEGVVRTKVVVR